MNWNAVFSMRNLYIITLRHLWTVLPVNYRYYRCLNNPSLSAQVLRTFPPQLLNSNPWSHIKSDTKQHYFPSEGRSTTTFLIFLRLKVAGRSPSGTNPAQGTDQEFSHWSCTLKWCSITRCSSLWQTLQQSSTKQENLNYAGTSQLKPVNSSSKVKDRKVFFWNSTKLTFPTHQYINNPGCTSTHALGKTHQFQVHCFAFLKPHKIV